MTENYVGNLLNDMYEQVVKVKPHEEYDNEFEMIVVDGVEGSGPYWYFDFIEGPIQIGTETFVKVGYIARETEKPLYTHLVNVRYIRNISISSDKLKPKPAA